MAQELSTAQVSTTQTEQPAANFRNRIQEGMQKQVLYCA